MPHEQGQGGQGNAAIANTINSMVAGTQKFGPAVGIAIGAVSAFTSVLSGRGSGKSLLESHPERGVLEADYRLALESTGVLDALVKNNFGVGWVYEQSIQLASRRGRRFSLEVQRDPSILFQPTGTVPSVFRQEVAGVQADISATLSRIKRAIVVDLLYTQPIAHMRLLIEAARIGATVQSPLGPTADRPGIVLEEEEDEMVGPIEPNQVDVARYQEGMQRSFATQVRPAALRSGIQPTLEVGQFLQPDSIPQGSAVQFVDTQLAAASGATVVLRMPCPGDRLLYIKETFANVNANFSTTAMTYIVTAGAVRTGGQTPLLRKHFVLQRFRSEGADVDINVRIGPFIVQSGEDYIIKARSIAVTGDPVKYDFAVQGFLYLKGVWPRPL